MSNVFEGVGNLGQEPKLSKVDGHDENSDPRSVCNIRVYFDRQVPDKQDGDFKDKGGFWLSVDIWAFRADEAMRLLKKGSRIFVKGSMREVSWNDAESGELRKEIRLTADLFFIDSMCVESVVFKSKRDVN
ncbi:MAG: single-stranded DNA-binding protein [Gammaproteobacteria bacterium]|nr:single-stranded DNA-binding protein [Gammaproteobacteria bacterium]